MKKILIILIMLFCCTGCWDYNELNNLAIIGALGIDYEDKEFQVTLEILNNQKLDTESDLNQKFHLVTGNGDSIVSAVENATLKMNYVPYFMHLRLVIIGEKLSQTRLEDTIDYLLRSPKLSNEFLSVVAKDTTAKDILDSPNNPNPNISEFITQMMENSTAVDNVTSKDDFESLLSKGLSSGKEMAISTISKNDDILSIEGIAVFEDFKAKGYLNIQESMTYNLLLNNAENAIYKKECPEDENKFISVSVYEGKAKLIAEEERFKFQLTMRTSVVENNCNYDLTDEEQYKELKNDFTSIIEKNINQLMKSLYKYNSDILGLGNIYYKKYRIENEQIWKLPYKIDINLDLNKKGLIYEVPK